jgi:hypothetical protein
MKNMVNFGFSLIILIMTILAFTWLKNIQDTNDIILELDEQYDTKIAHAHTMRAVVSRRYNLLLSNLLIDDPFEVDERITQFYDEAFKYRQARKELHSMPMSEEEKELHDELDKISALPQEDNIKAAEMFRSGAPREEIEKILISARANQSDLLNLLDRFVELQKSKDDTIAEYSQNVFNKSIYWISFFGVVAFVISIFIQNFGYTYF